LEDSEALPSRLSSLQASIARRKKSLYSKLCGKSDFLNAVPLSFDAYKNIAYLGELL
jgi:hypothetical protein